MYCTVVLIVYILYAYMAMNIVIMFYANKVFCIVFVLYCLKQQTDQTLKLPI